MFKQNIILGEIQDFQNLLAPVEQRLDKLFDLFQKSLGAGVKQMYSDQEAAAYLKCSQKKLQTLRNKRQIGFIRQDGGRKILYRQEHLAEYLLEHELKKKK